jgi:drug/metabolite transporter (DMT)-like permease
MLKKSLTLKIVLVLVFSDILETCAHFFFKKSAMPESGFQISNIADAFAFILTIIRSPFLWLGILSATLIFIAWSTVLSKIDLSVAVPIASFSYILVPIVSLVFLKEHISALRWAGILAILSGVALVSISTKNKERLI